MRILILNPNMTEAMTERMVSVAQTVAAPDTELLSATASRGFPYISSRAEAQIAGALVLEMIAERITQIDAVIIAAYGDPGLRAARELFDIPVVGMAESAMLTACMLGERFSLVTFTANLAPWYLESVQAAGLGSRLASIRIPDESFRSVLDVRNELRSALVAEVGRAVSEDQADVVILGGAPLAGLAQEVPEAPAVLVDPISAALKQAEALTRVAPRGAAAGSFARPVGKPNQGLAPVLGDWIARDHGR
ncbi:MAG: aspartate/glutamate racemase family protein [Burkholderiaceae bacterium]